MKHKMLLNISASLASQIVGVLCGFVLPRLILSSYGSEINGLTQSVKQFLGVISFLEMGIGQVICSSLYRPLSKEDREQISSVLASGRKFYRQLALILVSYVLFLLCFYPILTRSTFDWKDTAALIAAMSISSVAQYYFGIVNEHLLCADQRNYIVYLLNIVTNVLNLILSALLIGRGASIQTVKLVASGVYLIRPVVIAGYVRLHYHVDRAVKYQGEPISQKWNGVAQHISAVVLDGTDTIVLTLFATLTSVSVYSVYYMIISSLQMLYQSVISAIQSAAGAVWARNDQSARERMFRTVEISLHFVTVFLFSCAGVLIVPFVRVYTNGLTDADYIQPVFAAVLVLAYAIRCLRSPYNIWILAAGHFKQTQKCHITAAAINVVLSILVVHRYGLIGVAVGTLCAMLYQTGYMVLYNVRHLMHRPLCGIVKQFLVDGVTAGMIFAATSWINLGQPSFLGWFLMACTVALTALFISAGAAFLFYRREICALVRGRRA